MKISNTIVAAFDMNFPLSDANYRFGNHWLGDFCNFDLW